MKSVIWLVALLLCASGGAAQTVTWVQQPAPAVGTLGGYAEFSFTVDVPIAFANLGIIAYKTGTSGNLSNRFAITSSSIANNITTAGNFTRGEFTVSRPGTGSALATTSSSPASTWVVWERAN